MDDMIENIRRTIDHYFNPAGGKQVTFVLMVDDGKETRYASNMPGHTDKAFSVPNCYAVRK